MHEHRAPRHAPTCCYGRCCSMCHGGADIIHSSPKEVDGLPAAIIQRNLRCCGKLLMRRIEIAVEDVSCSSLSCFQIIYQQQQDEYPLHAT